MKISLPLIHMTEKKRALFWGAFLFLLGYLLLGSCPLAQPVHLPLSAWEQAIPLLPWTLLVYLSDYVFILLVLLHLKDAEAFSRTFYRMIAAIVISFTVFLLFPTVYPRPTEIPSGFWAEIFSYLHWIDQPTNCFPSLHVSVTLLAAAALPASQPRLRWGGWIWAIAICLSTLTTKQHYAVDILGGMFVSLACVIFRFGRIIGGRR